MQVGAGAMDMWHAVGDVLRMASMSLALASMYLSRGEVRRSVELLEGSLLLSRRYADFLSYKCFHAAYEVFSRREEGGARRALVICCCICASEQKIW